MLKRSMTSRIECKVPPENVLLYAISDILKQKHVIVEMGLVLFGTVNVEQLT